MMIFTPGYQFDPIRRENSYPLENLKGYLRSYSMSLGGDVTENAAPSLAKPTRYGHIPYISENIPANGYHHPTCALLWHK